MKYGDNRINDSDISASTVYLYNNVAPSARLNKRGMLGGWSPLKSKLG